MARPLSSRLTGAAFVGVVAFALVAGAATPASAHSQLLGSNPSSGQVLTELPAVYAVSLNERLLIEAGDAAFALRVRDDAGLYYGDGCLTIDDSTVTSPAAIGEPGEYTLEWQVVSADGHPVGGEIPFTWRPASEVTPSEGFAEAPRCGEAAEEPAEPEDATDDASSDGPDDAGAEHGAADADIPVGDVLWLVGGAFVLAIGVTVALLVSRRGRAG